MDRTPGGPLGTVAVTGAAGTVGRAAAAALGALPGVDRVVGLDRVAPSRAAAVDGGLAGGPDAPAVRRVDLRDPVLATALDGVDVLVHCDTWAIGGPRREDADEAFARHVHGTRNLLAAAGAVGVQHLVLVSHAAVYGAYADNPLPLDESAALRATPDCPQAWQRVIVEDLVSAWAAEHPGSAVTVLRPATLLDPAADDALAALLTAPLIPRVKGHVPPLQFLHPDDLAAAVAFTVGRGIAGVYDVAADGWVPYAEAARLLRRRDVALGEAVAAALLDRLWRWGAAPLPSSGLGYLMHPWVLSTAGLRGLGWAPRHSNREALRAYAAAHAGRVRLGPVATTYRRIAATAAGTGAAGVLFSGIAAFAVYRRRRRGTSPSRRPPQEE